MSAGGTYTLVVELPTETTLSVGALGDHRLPAGAYAYTGSALGSGGFSRVDRHRRIARGEHDVRHWHIDYLLGHRDARIDGVVRSERADVECAVAGRLPEGPIAGFGSSDCGCRSHLSRVDDVETLRERVKKVHAAATPGFGADRDARR
ncbi:GIY-YIG nuclease family protein [Halorubrum sp. DTA98]|uniref:GIY-YIG nuclease family protein n=1 Tax=Halorubrum sp. DTA98 TaxID=3402163 RepID=UPI003AAED842